MTEREVMADLVRFVGVLTYGKERWFKQNGCWYDRLYGDYIQNESLLERIIKAIKDEVRCDSADRPPGEWVEVEDYNGDIHYQCDQCGEEFILIDGTPEDNNYWHCPNCGSYNGGGEAVVKGADNESTL